MKKIILLLLVLFMTSQTGNCALVKNDINLFNIKTKNMYLLDVDSTVKNINISNKNIVNVIPITSLYNDKKQLFIEANDNGICDVILTTDLNAYQIRFISGPNFQDNKVGLTEIDLPVKYESASK